MNNKLSAIVLVAALSLGLTACGEKEAPVSSAPVATQEATTPKTSADDAVAVKAVELFRITVPNDPSTDEQIVAEMKAKGDEILAFLDAGGTGDDFLKQEAAKDPANVVRNQSLLTGAIALDPSISAHPNY